MLKCKNSCGKEVGEVKMSNDVPSAGQDSSGTVNNVQSSVKETNATKLTSTTIANFCVRRSWITTDRLNELRRKAQEAVQNKKTFTIRGCFFSVRTALTARGWVEKLDVHRKQIPTGVCQVTYEDLAQSLPKRKPGESRRQYVAKCERNILSRFLEHVPIDFLWTSSRKEKCDYIDQVKNPGMTINRFHRVPFTSKEGLCSQLRDFHWFYEEDTAETYFPRCYNVWSPEELNEFIENFRITACIAYIRRIVEQFKENGFDAIFSPNGKIPFTSIEFALKRCQDFLDTCHHNDIDIDETSRVWDHEWEAFLNHQYQMSSEGAKIFSETHRLVESVIRNGDTLLANVQRVWPQYALDGYQNLWIVKPANKCRGRGIQIMDNLKKIFAVVNPSIASKSRFVVQKYIERPLTIHNTKFDIRQWFLITNVQPLVVWMYKESYLRFSSQEYSLSNLHESVHLTNHAIQKKYTNGKRDKRLPNENMWDCYSFQAYLRQIGKHHLWSERIYPGMRKAIIGTMLASQDNMDRRPNTFELFGADFMICDDFSPWLIEINSSPDLGATTSVTARMCPQCLEDVVKVVIDRKADPKSDLGNFEQIYRQVVPPTPAYMGLNLFVKGKQITTKNNHHQHFQQLQSSQPRERCQSLSSVCKLRSTSVSAMPTFNATERISKCIFEVAARNSKSYLYVTNSSLMINSTSSSPRNRLATTNSLATIITSPMTVVAAAAAAAATAENQQQYSSKHHQSFGSRIQLKSPEKLNYMIKKCILQGGNGNDSHVSKSDSLSIVGQVRRQKQAPSVKVNRSKRQRSPFPYVNNHGELSMSSPLNRNVKQQAYRLQNLSDKKMKKFRERNLVRTKLDKEQSMSSIHAIGKSIKSSWEPPSSRQILDRLRLTSSTTILGNQFLRQSLSSTNQSAMINLESISAASNEKEEENSKQKTMC